MRATAEPTRLFEVIERLHTDGDEHVKGLATVGYLESIQTRSGESRALGQAGISSRRDGDYA